MKGINQDWRYEIDAIGVVKKDSAGHFFEEYSWSNLRDNRPGAILPAAVSSFRQVVSLDSAGPMDGSGPQAGRYDCRPNYRLFDILCRFATGLGSKQLNSRRRSFLREGWPA